ncbi:MAG TPA: hypothetical protein DCO75_08110 [Fibrobacteres bacterium]|nr:hypothetical protein [Fibrobacterota bacterium]
MNLIKKPYISLRKKQTDLPSIIERFELKYTIPVSFVEPISKFVSPYCSLDKYSEISSDKFYIINSLYFDTPDFLFLRQRRLRTENRFNMRIRSYGESPTPPYFLEIKQRRGDTVKKYRAKVFDENLEAMCNDPESVFSEKDDKNENNRELFRRTLLKYNARPVVLVQYKRKAYISDIDDYARVTFDIGLSSMPPPLTGYQPEPDNGEITPCDVQTCFDSGCCVILELKCYTNFVPLWMIDMVRTFELKRRSFSKYSNCLRSIMQRNDYSGLLMRKPMMDEYL